MPLCIICSTEGAKYKCPTCQFPYCSIPCHKAHKEAHSTEEAEEEKKKKQKVEGTHDDSLLSQPQRPETRGHQQQSSQATNVTSQPQQQHHLSVNFSPLDFSVEPQRLFARYPQLRGQLKTIYNHMREPSPELSSDENAQNGREHSSSAGGRRRGGARRQHHWTEEKSLKEGLFTLTKMRELPGRQAEGLEEFKQLVLTLCVQRGDTTAPGHGNLDNDMANEDAVAALVNGLG